MKITYKNKIVLLMSIILLTLSIFIPLIKVESMPNPEVGLKTNYLSCFSLLIKGNFILTFPYIILVLLSIITSLVFYKNKVLKIINLISLLLIFIVGTFVLILFLNLGLLYIFSYIFCIIISIFSFKK